MDARNSIEIVSQIRNEKLITVVYLLLPAFNEEESIERLFIKLDDFFKKYFNNDYKILICDDGSTDKTLSEIRRFEYKYQLRLIP